MSFQLRSIASLWSIIQQARRTSPAPIHHYSCTLWRPSPVSLICNNVQTKSSQGDYISACVANSTPASSPFAPSVIPAEQSFRACFLTLSSTSKHLAMSNKGLLPRFHRFRAVYIFGSRDGDAATLPVTKWSSRQLEFEEPVRRMLEGIPEEQEGYVQ